MPVNKRGVNSVSKSGSAKLKGDVTLTAGTNVTLTQSGQDISIASSGSGTGGSGDMLAATYDPNSVASDAFSMDNMEQGTTNKYVTATDVTNLGNLSGTNTGDQTTITGNAGTATKLATARNIDGQSFDGSANITVIAPGTHAATSKTTPVDADEVPIVDSAASNVLKKLTWSNLKVTLKTYFDTLYPSGSGTVSGTNTGDQDLSTYYHSGGTDVTVADGGTGSSTASGARTNLGLVIGTDVQAHDSDLDTWATKTAPSGTVVGTSDSQTLTNKTLTSPIIANGDSIIDGNGNEVLTFFRAVSAVNNAVIQSSATGTGPLIYPTGSDMDIDLNLYPKNSGKVNVNDARIVTETETQTLTNKTLTTPTIGDFTNSTHNHSNAAGGGTLGNSALPTGTVVQMVFNETSAVATGTTLIPLDDTIPQITEGDQYLSQAITPIASTNKLIIEGYLMVAVSAVAKIVTVALFQDSTANALAVSSQTINTNSDAPWTIPFKFIMSAGTTSATTFKIRAGVHSAATLTVNGSAAARLFGASSKSMISITEVKA